MYGKIVGLVLGVLSFVALPVSVFAAAAEQVTIVEPNIDWAGIPQQIMGALTTPVIVGIGIALSIWVIFTGINFFRRSSRA